MATPATPDADGELPDLLETGGIPTPDAEFPPPPDDIAIPSAADLLVGALDGTLRRIANRPVRVRARSSPLSLARGRVDVVTVELRELPVANLLVDRMVVHASNLRIEPGLPPRLKAGPVGFKATVVQSAVDRWTKASHLPIRLRLTADGVVVRTGVRRLTVTEVTTELSAKGPFLRLRPTSASMLGLRTSRIPPLPGYLPLPPLPAGAKLTKVEHADGALTVWFDLGDVDEAITPALARRLTRRFALPF